ncbi:MAG: hypothetical protein IJ842_02325 [Bacilli bacterium]|nr:hypothetical protein [Bacilli bacterium]
MYTIVNDRKYKNKNKLVDKEQLENIEGFIMASRRKGFKINNSEITDIEVVNKKLANPIVSKKVFKKYDKLILTLTDLLVDDDDTGDSLREALNRIEKFRLEIKIKYRKYLKKKELEKMSKQLVKLKKEAMIRLMEIQESYLDYINSNNRTL